MIWQLLPGRIAVEELLPLQSGPIYIPDDYHDRHERDRKCHRGRIVAMGGPASTRSGVPIVPDFGVGDEVVFVLAKTTAQNDYGSWSEKNRGGVWPPGGERKVLWIAQEEVIAVFDGPHERPTDPEGLRP